MGIVEKDDLKSLIENRQVVALVGPGVSVAVSDNAPTSSWQGLLTSARAYCEDILSSKLSAGWGDRIQGQIDSGDLDERLLAAAMIERKLCGLNGEFTRWIKRAFSLPLQKPDVLLALQALDIPILTINYDDLIEQATGYAGVSWKALGTIPRLMRGDRKGVLHLLGNREDPTSILLGLRSYHEVVNDPHTQAVTSALSVNKCFLLIGFDDGLNDPNEICFLQWFKEVLKDSPCRHYRLCLNQEEAGCPRQSEPSIIPLPFGESNDDLATFLGDLAPRPREGQGIELSDVVSRYLDRLSEETRRLNLIGLEQSLALDLDIEDVYVPLRMAFSVTEEKLRGRYDAAKLEVAESYEKDVDLMDIFTKAQAENKRGLLLLGEPGAGKTTGARQICYRLSSGHVAPEEMGLAGGTIPVLLRLRNLDPEDMEKGLKGFLSQETGWGGVGPEESDDPFTYLDQSSRLLWVLDGLDEVVDETMRDDVCYWIKGTLKERPEDLFLVTSRYQGYDGKVNLGSDFLRFQVQPLTDEQAGEFVDKWFYAVCQTLHAGIAAEFTAALKRVLAKPEYQIGGLREIRTNPLLLTILCVVFHQKRNLPEGRADLYGLCVRFLLEHWRQELTGFKPYNAEAAEKVLSGLAWWIHQESNRREMPFADMAEKAGACLASINESSGLGRDGEVFLQRMMERSEILATVRARTVGFLHLTFQEYLAALHAVLDLNKATYLAERIGESWWRELIFLALAKADESFTYAFFSHVLDQGEAFFVTHRETVDRCLREAMHFAKEPFLHVLDEEGWSDTGVSALLSLFRTKAFPELIERCGDLLDIDIAVEIIQRETGEHPSDQYIEPNTGMVFVRIPAGEFDMGSNKHYNENPIRRVKITTDFFLGKYPITNAEFAQYLATGSDAEVPDYWSSKTFNQPHQPVVGVSWQGAQAYCDWITEQLPGDGPWVACRLPTEAEWEYACRAGSTTDYYFGRDRSELDAYAWTSKNSDSRSHPVGEKIPNDWGLHDMHGNVWEWCEDWHGDYDETCTNDPQGPARGEHRVLRGGSWFNGVRNCRSAVRCGVGPLGHGGNLGFRVCLIPNLA